MTHEFITETKQISNEVLVVLRMNVKRHLIDLYANVRFGPSSKVFWIPYGRRLTVASLLF